MEAFLPYDVVNNPQNHFVTLGKADADGIDREAMKEIGGAIKWVNYPVVLVVLGLGHCPLFGNEASLWQQFFEDDDKPSLRFFVNV
jgi:hypothetical protein